MTLLSLPAGAVRFVDVVIGQTFIDPTCQDIFRKDSTAIASRLTRPTGHSYAAFPDKHIVHPLPILKEKLNMTVFRAVSYVKTEFVVAAGICIYLVVGLNAILK